MQWTYSSSSEEWWHWGILILEFCAAVCQCFWHLSFAPLRCTCAVEAPRGCECCELMGRARLTDGIFLVCLCTPLWPNCGKHLAGSLVWHFLAAAWMKVESISQALCSCTCVWKLQLQREKHLRITQCGFHIHALLPHSMWNVHSQHSSWNRSLLCLALELDFWLLFGYRSGPRPRNSVWLAPHDYRLARNDFHNCGFAESAGIQLKGSSNPISMQKVSAIAQWQGQQKNISEWKVSVGRSMHRVNWQHILGRSFLLLFHQPRPRKGYLHRRFLLSFIAQGQSKSKEKALQQPRLGAGRLLKIYTETVVRTAMSQKPAKTQTCFFDRIHVTRGLPGIIYTIAVLLRALKGINQNHLRAEGFCHLSMAGSTKNISERTASLHRSMTESS